MTNPPTTATPANQEKKPNEGVQKPAVAAPANQADKPDDKKKAGCA